MPEAVAGVRAKDLLSRAGPQAVQRAMVSSQPWRQLKAVCSNLVPSFQIVLPSELQAQIVRKVQSGEEVRPRRRAKADKSFGTARSSPVPPLAVPSPDLLEVPRVGSLSMRDARFTALPWLSWDPQLKVLPCFALPLPRPTLLCRRPCPKKPWESWCLVISRQVLLRWLRVRSVSRPGGSCLGTHYWCRRFFSRLARSW